MSAESQKFFTATGEFADLNSSLARAQEEYKAALSSAQSQKVCSTAFKQVIDDLDAKANSLNEILSNWNTKKSEILGLYNDLGFLEKRAGAVTAQLTNVTTLVKITSATQVSLVSQKPTRSELRQQYNSCQDLDEEENQEEKDAEKTDKQADQTSSENQDTGGDNSQGENQAPDDKTANVNTDPKKTNEDGQKETTNTGSSAGPAASTPQSPREQLVRKNPLSEFSSYTYNVSFYIVTPEAYNEYMVSNEMPKKGVYIVAQSGGMNNQSESRGLTDDGTPGPGKQGLDYFIDDLKFVGYFPAMHGQNTSTTQTECTFKIFEPMGFSFLPRLANLADVISKESPKIQATGLNRPLHMQMCYIMRVSFYGYDANGAIKKSDSTGPGDAYGAFGSYERYFPLAISNVKSTLEGKMTVYDFKATVFNERVAYGTMYGKVPSKTYIEAATVSEAIGSYEVKNKRSLIGGLNFEQEELQDQKKIEYANKYRVEYETDSAIRNARLIDDAEFAKETAAMSGATRVEEVTPKLALKANSIDTTKKKLEVPANMSVVNIIDQIITKSTYVTRGLNKVNNQRIETANKENPTVELEWFAIHPKVQIEKWDKKNNTWSYDITFQIKSYKVPFVRSQYVDNRTKYYGPLKRYDYWYTGKNTEIISYTQTFNNLYYIVQPFSVNEDATSETTKTRVPIIPNADSGGNDTTGKLNGGSKINEQVRQSLYSPADQSRANIRIMGDPDFLTEQVGGSIEFNKLSSSNLFTQFYARRGSISPYGGQVYIEIVFKTSDDYDKNGSGLQVINDQISFYGSAEQQKILQNEGVVYRVTKVESILRRGQFHQTLDCIIVPPSDLILPTKKGSTEGRPGGAQTQAEANNDETQRFASRSRAQQPLKPQQKDVRQIDNQMAERQQQEVVAGKTTGQANQNPLRSSQPSTPTAEGKPNVNDDASANNQTTRINTEGREEPPLPQGDEGE
jgi:hypothetical protein